jgi:uncharacterized protein (DUF433 family)
MMAEKSDNATALLDAVKFHETPTSWASALTHNHSLQISARWSKSVPIPADRNLRIAEWYIECSIVGADLLRKSVDVKASVRGGRAVLKGTGFTVSQTLVELADSTGVKEVADNFDLDENAIIEMLNGLAMLLSKPLGK